MEHPTFSLKNCCLVGFTI